MKAIFLILNMIIALAAFSWMISAALPPPTGFFAGNGQGIFGSLLGQGIISGAEKVIFSNFGSILFIAGIGYFIGSFIGGNADVAGALAGAGGTVAYILASEGGILESFSSEVLGLGNLGFGVVVGAIIFVAMYKKTETEIVEFNCLPYQPPIGGADCELCNEIEGGCSEYKCKSLGQACELVNQGTDEEKCVWVNPNDVNSPKIEVIDVLEGYIWKPDTSIRPPATGVYISQENGEDIEAFTALEFTIGTDEPSQCKIDYNLTAGFEEMSYFIGGTNIFSYNHTETMSLPSPDSINAIAPELKNDGTYTLYIRCQDANGNFNQDAYSIRFKVKEGPDTTPPKIVDLSVQSNSPINYNQTQMNLEVYVNEPSECKWSREDKDFNLMENTMSCDTNVWEMNNENVYTCRTTLTGIQDKTDNNYYFRCKDQPFASEADRNVNSQSSLYTIIGTQPLTLLDLRPREDEVIKGSTTTIPVFLEIKTDNGYQNGKSFCFFTTEEGLNGRGDENEFILFSETESNVHSQRQDLPSGTYTYYIKCVDLGGNTVYNSTTFEVESDNSAPLVVRAYKEAGQLRIATSEKAECAYSNLNCNFDIDEGIIMNTVNKKDHATDWVINKNYYIRCRDEFGNEPNIQAGNAGCSAVLRLYEIETQTEVIVL